MRRRMGGGPGNSGPPGRCTLVACAVACCGAARLDSAASATMAISVFGDITAHSRCNPRYITIMADIGSDPFAWRPLKAPSLVELEVLAGEVFRQLPKKFRE